MTPVEALRLAVEKEESAIKLYQSMAVKHKAISELLTSLLNEELKHKQLLEKKISELTE